MKEVFDIVIRAGGYNLTDILIKLEREWVLGNISDQERDELIEAARAHAKPQDSMAPLQQRIEALEIEVKRIGKKVDGGVSSEVKEPDAPLIDLDTEIVNPPAPAPDTASDDWPAFVRPTSVIDMYNKGDKVTYKGKHYISLMDVNVWPPDEYPIGWKVEP